MSERTSMNISLPGSMRRWVEDQVKGGGYGTVSEFFRDLVRDAQRDRDRETTERLLAESLASPSSEMTAADWNSLRRRARQADAATRKRASR